MHRSRASLGLLVSILVFAQATGCSCGTSHSRDDAGMSADVETRRDVGSAPDSPTNVDAGLECPSDINPWNPDHPANVCSPEGRVCSSGSGDACGFAMRCQCESGRWSCAVAEPDPACWCGRQPDEGSMCREEGMLCGSCCPTPDSPAFGPFTCVGQRWVLGDCPAVECPPLGEAVCPAVHATGGPCPIEGQTCGDACCSAIQCLGGVWQPGPDVNCACDPSRAFACGPGSCTADRACSAYCGPDDGLEHACIPLTPGCSRCECLPLAPGQTCEEVDGHVFIQDGGFCG